MKFSDLFNLIKEESFLEYEDWIEYIDYEDGIEKTKLESFINHFNLVSEFYMNGNYLNLKDSSNSYWLERNDDIYEKIADSDEDMKNSISNIQDYIKLQLMGITKDDLYIGGWGTTIGDLREYGGTVYHYTTEEKWEDIKSTKELRTSYGTGLTNRSENGIFTSVSPETYVDGTYGDILLEINLIDFKNDYKIDHLDLNPEPDVLEAAINNTFANALGFEDYDEYVSSDMSEETVIVGHVIPLKYITQL
jgi:hypothetical protein